MDNTSKPVALVTGGTRGIGFGCALHLAESGFNLALNGLRPVNAVAEPVRKLKSFGAEVVYCRGDIGSKEERSSIINAVREAFGRLNVLVNNAGIAPKERKNILETGEESFDRVIGVNLKGTFFLTQSIAKWMLEQKKRDSVFKGCIITISSISSTVASINRAEYCLAKAGLSMMTQLFAVRMGECDIPVYEVRPGIIKTDMTAAPSVTEKYDKLISDGLCVQKRWGYPQDVGKAVAALAEGCFSYSTGQVVMVDGGLTIPRL